MIELDAFIRAASSRLGMIGLFRIHIEYSNCLCICAATHFAVDGSDKIQPMNFLQSGMRKGKNKSFSSLAAAALSFVQTYLHDIVHKGSIAFLLVWFFHSAGITGGASDRGIHGGLNRRCEAILAGNCRTTPIRTAGRRMDSRAHAQA